MVIIHDRGQKMGLLDNQTAIVFGGSGLIGSAICKTLAYEGARVIVHFHRNSQAAQDVVSQIKDSGGTAKAFHADVTDDQAVSSLVNNAVELFGSIHIVVNTVHGSSEHKLVREMRWSNWQAHLNALRGHFIVCKSVLPIMREQRYGRIVYLSGGLSYRYFRGCAAYSAMKTGLNSFCKTLALEEGEYNITVNIVAPGKVVPGESGKTIDQESEYDELGDRTAVQNPLGRFATPDDVAGAVLYFVSPQASGITGQTLYVACGEIMP